MSIKKRRAKGLSYRVPHDNIYVSAKTVIHVLSDIQVDKITKMMIQINAYRKKKIVKSFSFFFKIFYSIFVCTKS